MRVARLHAVGDLRLSDEPAPRARPGHTLVRVGAVGICGSDLHWYAEGGIGDARLDRPLVPGHEMAGRTVDGTLVALDPAAPCHRCEMCHAGHPNLCPDVVFAGHGETDGGLREWVAWPDEQLVTLPAGLSAADGAMLEPLGVAVHAMDLAHPRPGMTVAVAGCGPIGLLLVQLARACGALRARGRPAGPPPRGGRPVRRGRGARGAHRRAPAGARGRRRLRGGR